MARLFLGTILIYWKCDILREDYGQEIECLAKNSSKFPIAVEQV